jgi:hypothetical protein
MGGHRLRLVASRPDLAGIERCLIFRPAASVAAPHGARRGM